LTSVVLALAAALAWGVSDFLGGLFTRRIALLQVLLISQLVGSATLVLLATLQGPSTLDARAVGFAMGASASGLVGIAALYRGMAVGVVSIVAPISATGAALPVLFGLLQGEHASTLQMIGIGLALLGIVLASRSQDALRASEPVRGRGVGFALLAALGFGGFFILIHEASARDVLWAGAVQRLTGLAIVTLLVVLFQTPLAFGWRTPLASRGRTPLALGWRTPLAFGWRSLPGLVVVGLLDTTANVLFAYASTTGLVSLASVLASLFPVVTVILAWFVLHERLARPQAVGVACALTGVALIATP